MTCNDYANNLKKVFQNLSLDDCNSRGNDYTLGIYNFNTEHPDNCKLTEVNKIPCYRLPEKKTEHEYLLQPDPSNSDPSAEMIKLMQKVLDNIWKMANAVGNLISVYDFCFRENDPEFCSEANLIRVFQNVEALYNRSKKNLEYLFIHQYRYTQAEEKEEKLFYGLAPPRKSIPMSEAFQKLLNLFKNENRNFIYFQPEKINLIISTLKQSLRIIDLLLRKKESQYLINLRQEVTILSDFMSKIKILNKEYQQQRQKYEEEQKHRIEAAAEEENLEQLLFGAAGEEEKEGGEKRPRLGPSKAMPSTPGAVTARARTELRCPANLPDKVAWLFKKLSSDIGIDSTSCTNIPGSTPWSILSNCTNNGDQECILMSDGIPCCQPSEGFRMSDRVDDKMSTFRNLDKLIETLNDFLEMCYLVQNSPLIDNYTDLFEKLNNKLSRILSNSDYIPNIRDVFSRFSDVESLQNVSRFLSQKINWLIHFEDELKNIPPLSLEILNSNSNFLTILEWMNTNIPKLTSTLQLIFQELNRELRGRRETLVKKAAITAEIERKATKKRTREGTESIRSTTPVTLHPEETKAKPKKAKAKAKTKAKAKPKSVRERKTGTSTTPKVIIPPNWEDETPFNERENCKERIDNLSRRDVDPITLKDYQRRVVDFLLVPNHRGLIAIHATGSGKTYTAITTLICTTLADPSIKNVILIAKKATQQQWLDEISKYKLPRGKYEIFVQGYPIFYDELNKPESTKGKVRIFIMTSDTYASRWKALCGETKKCGDVIRCNNILLIIDEAHGFKAETGVEARLLINCAKSAKKVLLLTATPTPNNIVDISNLISMITREDPLTESLFRMEVANLRKYRNPNSNPSDYFKCKLSIYERNLKGDGDIYWPTVEEKYLHINMDPEYYKQYEQVEKGLEVSGQTSAPESFYIGLRLWSNKNASLGSKKAKRILDILRADKNKGKKTMIFSEYIGAGLDTVKDLLEKNGFKDNIVEISGEASINRPLNIARYNAMPDEVVVERNGLYKREKRSSLSDEDKKNLDIYDPVQIIVLGPAGREGVDLKNTRLIFLLEPAWNRSNEEQAMARGIRFMSHEALDPEDRNVIVYHLILDFPTLEQLLAFGDPALTERVELRKRNPESKPSIDNYVLKVQNDKQDEIKEFLKLIRPYSIEEMKCDAIPSEKKEEKKSYRVEAEERKTRSRSPSPPPARGAGERVGRRRASETESGEEEKASTPIWESEGEFI